MTPEAFINKWRSSNLKERSSSQEHFIDLCRLLGEATPAEADPDGTWYCFERGASKTGGGNGWADVWRKCCFGWEYKGKGKDMAAALKQLQIYAPALESPPLLIVCDTETIYLHTVFTNTVPTVHVITLDDLADADKRRLLKWAFTEPERLRPGLTIPELTEGAASRFASLAESLRQRGHEPHRVAHFLNKILFCLFAEDAGLLPRQLFTRLLESTAKAPAQGENLLKGLFSAMAKGGAFGVEVIDWFNGGLFDGDDTLPLAADESKQLLALSRLDWSAIEPAIFGTLFERGLDPAKRSQLGAHYTDRASIMRLINPVIREPLLAEWEAVKALISKDKSKGRKKADQAYAGFLERLRNFRILDPACGSGNFLYLALQTLKDLEHQAILEAEALGLPRQFPSVGPEAVHGLELNPYAAELARVTVWIGEIQWMMQHGYGHNTNPILKPLETIEQRDAVLNEDGTEAEWPAADVIIGNPPFLGGSKFLSGLGDEYTKALRACYRGRVPGGADLVCYWFEKARAQIETGKTKRAGLVATNSIRGGANRKVLERINETGQIFHAWSDEPWVNEGAAVRVSLVAFADHDEALPVMLDGKPTGAIFADLTAGINNTEGVDLTQARQLIENFGICCYGSQQKGSFEVSENQAIQYLLSPNVNLKGNSEVIKRSINARRLMQRESLGWVIDFGFMLETEVIPFELPYEHLRSTVYVERTGKRDIGQAKRWWQHARPSPTYRGFLTRSTRCIVSPAVAKHRVFCWLPPTVLADHALLVFCRSDNATFGVLHSRFHELWSLRMGTSLEDRPRYTPTTTFETFPFPEGVLTDTAPDSRFPAIAEAASRLNDLRENWLNPPEWVERVPEVVPGYPDRILPKPGHEADLKKRTLTNLYNQRPSWLDNAHKTLDKAVAEAYGWTDYSPAMPDEEILRRLLELNLERLRVIET